MSSQDEHLDSVLTIALSYQQDFYELLPDWTIYKRNEIKYLKQNIGYAIYGSPSLQKNLTLNNTLNSEINNTTDDKEIIDFAHYGCNAMQTINRIVDQISKHGWLPGDDIIRCGIIYLLLIDNDPSIQCDKQANTELIALPLFKIMKYNDNNEILKQKINGSNYTTWYIDVKGRVYKGWDDFLMTNDLPKCIMIYPKDGYYQPDPSFEIAPNNSFVWVIAKDSIACCQRAKTYSMINSAANIIGAGATVGLGVASMITPIAPFVAAAGLVTAGVSGIWTIGTCSMDLYDKSVHEESINPFYSTSALSSWLGIAGCTVGIMVSGGSFLLSRAAMSGTTVGTAAKTVYNTALFSSISINLIGLGYQGYNMYEKFQETGTFDMQDVFYFGTHLLFFMNSVVNIKFANDIIEMTQGKVLKEYEANLRDDTLRKRYNNMKNKITATTTDKIEQNAAIIRCINKFDTTNISEIQPISNSLQSSNNIIMVQQCKLQLNGITLIDPLLFIADFAKSYFCGLLMNMSEDSSSSDSTYSSRRLEKILESLLGDFYTSRDCPTNKRLYGVPDFKIIINELKKIKNSEDILPFIFNIALILIKQSNKYVYLIEGCYFVWDYIKKNMHEAGFKILSKLPTNSCDTLVKHLKLVVGALFDAMDSLINRFLNAFHQYLNLTKGARILNSSV